MCPAYRLQRLEHGLAAGAGAIKNLVTVRPRHGREGQQQMLRGDVLVLERLGLVFRLVEHLIELARHRGLGTTGLPGIALHFALDLRANVGDVGAELVQQRNDNAFRLAEEREQEMAVIHERVAISPGERDGIVERFGRLDGKPIGTDHDCIRMLKYVNKWLVTHHSSMMRQLQCQAIYAVLA
jgi:hypothetical protein